jgi:hypothetical protein
VLLVVALLATTIADKQGRLKAVEQLALLVIAVTEGLVPNFLLQRYLAQTFLASQML